MLRRTTDTRQTHFAGQTFLTQSIAERFGFEQRDLEVLENVERPEVVVFVKRKVPSPTLDKIREQVQSLAPEPFSVVVEVDER